MNSFAQAQEYVRSLERRVQELEKEVDNKRRAVSRLKHRRTVKFDEATIAEHDKERGTRMKIDEPKTPYVREEQGEPYWPDEDDIQTPNPCESIDSDYSKHRILIK